MTDPLPPADRAKYAAAAAAVAEVQAGMTLGAWHRIDRGLDAALPGCAHP
jgi:hypothetical protein